MISEAQTYMEIDSSNNLISKNKKKRLKQKMNKAKAKEKFDDAFKYFNINASTENKNVMEDKDAIREQYKLMRNEVRHLIRGNTTKPNELPIVPVQNTSYNFDKIKKNNEETIKYLFENFIEKNYNDEINGSPVIDEMLNEDVIPEKNLVCCIIGKILEIQKYNDNAIKQKIRKGLPLLKINNYKNIMKKAKKYSDIINCAIYFDTTDHVKKTIILQAGIFKYKNNTIGRKILQLLHKNMELVVNDYKIVEQDLYMNNSDDIITRYNDRILSDEKYQLREIDDIHDKLRVLCYNVSIAAILTYIYAYKEITIHNRNIISKYSKIADIFIEQLLNIDNIVLNREYNIEEKISKINSVVRSGISQFTPYISYYKNLINIVDGKLQDVFITIYKNKVLPGKNIIEQPLTKGMIHNIINEFITDIENKTNELHIDNDYTQIT